jgi:hypothetical protein
LEIAIFVMPGAKGGCTKVQNEDKAMCPTVKAIKNLNFASEILKTIPTWKATRKGKFSSQKKFSSLSST